MEAEAVRDRLELALADEHDEAARRDIAFHMTDWMSDLIRLVRIYESPAAATNAEIREGLMAFLIHAPAHIVAASKLVTGLPTTDVFGIGAVAERLPRS